MAMGQNTCTTTPCHWETNEKKGAAQADYFDPWHPAMFHEKGLHKQHNRAQIDHKQYLTHEARTNTGRNNINIKVDPLSQIHMFLSRPDLCIFVKVQESMTPPSFGGNRASRMLSSKTSLAHPTPKSRAPSKSSKSKHHQVVGWNLKDFFHKVFDRVFMGLIGFF